MIKGNSYAYILEPQPQQALTPPLPPQQDVILNKTGSTNGFGAYAVLLPGRRPRRGGSGQPQHPE